jgi:hypothetical protein
MATTDPCQPEIPSLSGPNFVPVNDAQWTIVGFGSADGRQTANRAGYAIAVPDEGLLRYEDRTSENAGLPGLIKARSIWYVSVTRTTVK